VAQVKQYGSGQSISIKQTGSGMRASVVQR
jgi:hypothetical protein